MRCPFCGHEETQVKDSRPSDDGRVIRRRRECNSCTRRFTTFERFQIQQLLVVKREGSRELFDRDKLTSSLTMALNKRPVPSTQISQMTSDIEQKFTEIGASEVSSKDIGDSVMNALKKLDFVAFVRYASVYEDFSNTEDFRKLISDNE